MRKRDGREKPLSEIKKIPVDRIRAGNFRVRESVDEEKLQMLVDSIKRQGMLYPIVVKPLGDGTYELIAGERRLLAAKKAGLREVPAIERKGVSKDYELIEMGIENLQREDLSFYERGRWVAKMKELGWTVSALAEETGITRDNLQHWLEYYEQARSISTTVGTVPTDMSLRGMLEVKRAPIPEEKKAELVAEATKLPEPPSVTEIQRAARLIEQEPTLPAREALERARGITVLVPIPVDLMPKLKAQADEWGVSIQEAIIQILRDYLE
jgi:ParB family chromosome partitioning protein